MFNISMGKPPKICNIFWIENFSENTSDLVNGGTINKSQKTYSIKMFSPVFSLRRAAGGSVGAAGV